MALAGRNRRSDPHQKTLTVSEISLREEPDFAWRKFGLAAGWEHWDKWGKERELASARSTTSRWRSGAAQSPGRAQGCRWPRLGLADPAELYGQTHPETLRW